MLNLQNIVKHFKGTKAVENLNIHIPENSIFGLLGPNGAGKTTTIRMIMNIIQPDSGEIFFHGKKIKRKNYLKIGYLPEERGLYQKMKLQETLVYLSSLKGISRSVALNNVNKYLKRFGLTSYSNRKIEELSKGNQQKVQFILSIVHEPELIILDEPFSGLDPVNQLILKEIINDLHSKGVTIIFSTHQMEQVEKMCSQICLINRGHEVLHGNLTEIKKNYGLRSVKVEFSGDQKKLQKCNSLRNIEISENILQAEIGNNVLLNDVLKEIMTIAEIRHFKLCEPNLEQIFIDQVNKETDL